MEIEVWKDVVGYEDRFQISSHGRLYSKLTNKILSQTVIKTGYLTHATKIGGRKGKAVLFKIHRLVAQAFIPNPEDKATVNHVDGDKKNNNVWNLEWATYSENSQHAYDTGLASNEAKRGTANEKAKLTKSDIEYIVANAKQNGGKLTQRAMASMFNVNHVTIGRVLRGQSYN